MLFVLIMIVTGMGFSIISVIFSGATPDFNPLPPNNTPFNNLATDALRPQFHLLPPKNFMNDPCGKFRGESYRGGILLYNGGVLCIRGSSDLLLSHP